MNVKKKYVLLALVTVVSLSACNNQTDAVNQGADAAMGNANSAIAFPETYTMTDGNVKYNLSLEMPEDIDVNNFREVDVCSILYNDTPAALEYLCKDKAINETQVIPADEFTPEEYSYYFDDGSRLSAGGSTLTCDSPNSEYYRDVFYRISNDTDLLQDEPPDFSFAAPSDCLQEIEDIMKATGYDTTVSASVFSLTAEQAKAWEEHLTIDGDRQEEAYKEEWTEEDNAYIISAYQTYNGVPVFNEMLAMNQEMAVDSPDNAPIQAICTARGLESLMVIAQYEFSETKEEVSFLPFEMITKTISTKLNNILSESPYEVYKAKLFLMVRYVTARDYEAFPVWYFEAREEGSDEKMVLIVDAVTGEEINIGQ